MKNLPLLLIILFAYVEAYAQIDKKRYQERTVQVSLAPGVGFNGIHSAWYVNKYALNIFSGYSAATRYLSISGISSTNTQYATGIQLAGIANVVGSNTFINLTIGEERKQMRDGFESNMTGIQFAGLLNLIRDNVRGWQVTGGINFVHKGSTGWQVAGLANMVGSYNFGVQMAGLYNVALRSSSGIQLAVFSNLTNGEMQGLQLSLLNKAWRIEGKQSDPPSKLTGWQVGLLNIANTMNGLQIGLVNRAKKMRGTQIGLINFFSTRPNKKHGKSGTPIGLLNFGSKGGHQRVSTTETFLYNIEFTTGNCYNCTKTQSEMPLKGRFKIMNQNALIFAYNPLAYRGAFDPYWAFGYGFEKVKYNKHSMSPADLKNEKRFIAYGIKMMHLSYGKGIENSLSLLTKLNLEYGRILRNKIMTFYLFAGISANAYLYDRQQGIAPESISYTAQEESFNYDLWPGYEVGIHLR